MAGEPMSGRADSDAFFYLALDPLCIADTDGRFLRVNPAWEGVLGYGVDEFSGFNYFDLVHPDDLERTHAATDRLRARGSVIDFTNRLRAKDGTYRAIEWQSTSPDGVLVYAAGRDVTEALATAEELRLSEQKFATAFHTSPDAVNINRLSDGLYLEINEGFTRLTGYTEEDVAGRTSRDIDIWGDPADRERLVRWLKESGRVDNLEAQFRRKDGTLTTALMSARIMELRGETCILSVTRDISLRKEAEQEVIRLMGELDTRVRERTAQLAAANEQLARVNEEQQRLIDRLEETNHRLDVATRAKNDFLASMSHELRTPLNSVIGFSGMLLSGLAGELEDEQRKQVGMINSAGRHLLELINNVLDLSKIEAGHMKVDFAPVGALEVASGAIETVRPIAEAKGLGVRLSGDTVSLVTDRTRLTQILLNLLGNAVKFTEAGSVSLEIAEDGGEVAFTVRDTGRGIPADDLPHVFEEFYQGSSPVGAKTAGTGLGLSVSARLAAMLGGRIEASSDAGAGSVFTVRLPKEGPERA